MTWFIKGDLVEEDVSGKSYKYKRSLVPKLTPKSKNHRVLANKDSYCFTIRGKWVDSWTEYNKDNDETTLFSWGRKILGTSKGLL